MFVFTLVKDSPQQHGCRAFWGTCPWGVRCNTCGRCARPNRHSPTIPSPSGVWLCPSVPQAGITVRLMTGDSMEMALALGMRCGLFTNCAAPLSMRGPEFQEMTGSKPQELMALLPDLRLLSRFSTKHKELFIGPAQEGPPGRIQIALFSPLGTGFVDGAPLAGRRRRLAGT